MARRAILLVFAVALGCTAAPCPRDDAATEDAAPADDASGSVALVATPSSIDVDDVCDPRRFDVELRNDGTTSSDPLTPTLYGPDAAVFSVVTSTCATGLAPGASCQATVELMPVYGQRRYVASVHVVAGERTYSVPIIAEVPWNCEPHIVAVQATLRFDDVVVGATGHAIATFQNGGRAISAPLSPRVVVPSSSPFAVIAAEDTCSGATLAPGATCTVGVAFTPTAPGTAYARLDSLLLGGTGI